MRRRPRLSRFAPLLGALTVLAVLAPSSSSAQYTPAPSASAAPSAAAPSAAPSPAPPAPAPAPSADTPRPPPGPAVRERGAGRRRANPASGVFFGLVIAFALGAWVIKRLRR